MRRNLALLLTVGLLLGVLAVPASAHTKMLAPLPGGMGHWLAGPLAQTEVAGSWGQATINHNGATITVSATGLAPGHAFTMWVVYFNHGPACQFGETSPATNCGLQDLLNGLGGATFGDGKVIGGSGKATFTAHLNVGDPASFLGAGYEPGESPDFHVILRSHGPKLSGSTQIQGPGPEGGCTSEVGPPPGQSGTQYPIPANNGECGDVQLYILETTPA